ncbi:MAG: hypothetical protein IH996_10125 [Proteobacteria bacterium]|nr:hypothetical protein [Pseudomonadota bacterium]
MAGKEKVVPSRIMKHKVEVEVVFSDGTKLGGSVYVGQSQRVLDLLNDADAFFPLMRDDGEVLLIAKSSLAVCKPLDTPG